MPPIVTPPPEDTTPVRRTVTREDLIIAALALIGPHRSLSTLSLREVAREAGIAPNSFYRQFRDMDELSIALIDLAGRSLRTRKVALASAKSSTPGKAAAASS